MSSTVFGHTYVSLPFQHRFGWGFSAQKQAHISILKVAITATSEELTVGLETDYETYSREELAAMLMWYYDLLSKMSAGVRSVLFRFSVVFPIWKEGEEPRVHPALQLQRRMAQALPLLEAVLVLGDDDIAVQDLLQRFNGFRQEAHLPLVTVTVLEDVPALTGEEDSKHVPVSSDDSDALVKFEHTVMGGTFDHYHSGHKLLLSMGALLATSSLSIGLTTDQLLVNKSFAQVLQPFELRKNTLEAFLRLVNPLIRVDITPLADIYGCSLKPELNALILSKEPKVASNGQKVNEERKRLGLSPLVVVIVELTKYSHDATEKVSSTTIRQYVTELEAKKQIYLENQWRLLCQTKQVADSISAAWWTTLKTRYRESTRYYHTLSHIHAMLTSVDTHMDRFTDVSLVRLATWFHDVVYDATRQDNEARSADLFAVFAQQAGLDPAESELVQQWILATQAHEVPLELVSPDALVFMDIDLEILCAAPLVYQQYAAAIQQEYKHVPPLKFTELRPQFLAAMLSAKEKLFQSPLFGERHELLAQLNISTEIAALQAAHASLLLEHEKVLPSL